MARKVRVDRHAKFVGVYINKINPPPHNAYGSYMSSGDERASLTFFIKGNARAWTPQHPNGV